jgi:hypothetical protein
MDNFCNHIIGTYWTDYVGNGTFTESEKDEGAMEDYASHYTGFKFNKFDYCPMCGESL